MIDLLSPEQRAAAAEAAAGKLMLERQRLALMEERRREQEQYILRQLEEEERRGRRLQEGWDRRGPLTAAEAQEREAQIAAHLRHHAELQLIQVQWQHVQEQQRLLQEAAAAAAEAAAAAAAPDAPDELRAEHLRRLERASGAPSAALLQLREFHERQLREERERLREATEVRVWQVRAGEKVDLAAIHRHRRHRHRHHRHTKHHTVEFVAPGAESGGADSGRKRARPQRKGSIGSDNAPTMAPLLLPPATSGADSIAGAFGTSTFLSSRGGSLPSCSSLGSPTTREPRRRSPVATFPNDSGVAGDGGGGGGDASGAEKGGAQGGAARERSSLTPSVSGSSYSYSSDEGSQSDAFGPTQPPREGGDGVGGAGPAGPGRTRRHSRSHRSRSGRERSNPEGGEAPGKGLPVGGGSRGGGEGDWDEEEEAAGDWAEDEQYPEGQEPPGAAYPGRPLRPSGVSSTAGPPPTSAEAAAAGQWASGRRQGPGKPPRPVWGGGRGPPQPDKAAAGDAAPEAASADAAAFARGGGITAAMFRRPTADLDNKRESHLSEFGLDVGKAAASEPPAVGPSKSFAGRRLGQQRPRRALAGPDRETIQQRKQERAERQRAVGKLEGQRVQAPRTNERSLEMRRRIARTRWLVAFAVVKNQLRAEAAERDARNEAAASRKRAVGEKWRAAAKKSSADLAQAGGHAIASGSLYRFGMSFPVPHRL